MTADSNRTDTATKKPVHYCNVTLEGPKMGRRVVLWRKQCRHRVQNAGDRCWQHKAAS